MKTIEERITELMNGDYDPLRPDNLAETLANLKTEQIVDLAYILRTGCYFTAGIFIKNRTIEHWTQLAKTQAEVDEENEYLAACERCHGEGCSHCNDLDDDRRTDNE